jgi:hypothetical protein
MATLGNNRLIELQQDPAESSEICIELPGYAKPAKTYASYPINRHSGAYLN